jgi:hypothetical protein
MQYQLQEVLTFKTPILFASFILFFKLRDNLYVFMVIESYLKLISECLEVAQKYYSFDLFK